MRWIVGVAVVIVGALALAIGALIASTPRPEREPVTSGTLRPGQVLHEGRTRSWLAYVPPIVLLFAGQHTTMLACPFNL